MGKPLLLKQLPPRKQKYVLERAKGLSRVRAARAAGYSESVSLVAAQQVDTPDVRAVFKELLQRAVPPASLIKRIREGLGAYDTRLAQVDGQFTDERQVPDFAARQRYAQMCAEYAGYAPEKESAVSLTMNTLSVMPISRSQAVGPPSTPDPKVIDVTSTNVPRGT